MANIPRVSKNMATKHIFKLDRGPTEKGVHQYSVYHMVGAGGHPESFVMWVPNKSIADCIVKALRKRITRGAI